MAPNDMDERLSHLARLGQKPGVQSTLILSRDTGAILRTTGLISKATSANPNSTLPSSETGDSYTSARKESGLQSAEDVASMVWSFLGAAGSLVEKLDEEDEVKLLRLRMKKNELIIMPDPNFIHVMIHDTPLA